MEYMDFNRWSISLPNKDRPNTITHTWEGYVINEDTKYDVYWAYALGGGCLLAAGESLAEAKNRCYEHFENKPTELP